ncbi:MAG: bifunctional metallophosphatase/5'-nucleotidase [Lewinellaceae bacterium]|nr:bifunctional metallophosphatase/5'-nucleotidase [Lewinellaceae bacterium]
MVHKMLIWFILSTLGVGVLRAQPQEITFLYTNDIESVYEPMEAYWNDTIAHIGGMPYLASLIHAKRAAAPISFLFDAGDIFTGALSQVSQGALPFEIYSAMGYDAITLGNHEFEYGWERLREVQQRARFPVLNANIYYANTDIPYCRAYTILEKQGIRVGVIGAMGLEAFKNTINPAHRQGLEARDPIGEVQRYIDLLRPEVDLIVVLTHQNQSAPMQTDKEADPEVQRGFAEDYAMAGQLRGADIIFGGHSDNGLWAPVQHPVTGTLIGLTFGQGKYLGSLTLSLDKSTGTKKMLTGQLIPVMSDQLTPDPQVTALIEKYRTASPAMTQVLGQVDKTAFRKYYRESTLGNLLADLLLEAAQSDIAVINPGSLRADLNAGAVTVEDLVNIYPFIDKFQVKEISGQALHDLLEYSYEKNYGVAQLAGITTRFDSRRPAGKRLISATIQGKPLDLKRQYTIAASNFLANGGDGYSMLKAGRLISESEGRMIEALITVFRWQATIQVPALGRQVDIAKE